MFGTALTLGLLRNKLREHRLLDSTDLREVHAGETVAMGRLSVEFVHTTHSIPDACALALHTPLGTIVHSGDFKLDHTPIHGEPPDLARLARLGDEGVLLLMSDSTNVESEGITPSERSVGPSLARIFAESPGRVLMATFASNISRLQQAFDAASADDRRILVVGRSMMNNVQVAQELGWRIGSCWWCAPGRRANPYRRWRGSPPASTTLSSSRRATRWCSAPTRSPATRSWCIAP